MTVNEVFMTYLRNDATMKTTFGLTGTKAKVYYIANKEEKHDYATIWMIDDPKELLSLCVGDQGQSRFQCDSFTKAFVDGINARDDFQGVVGALKATIVSDINVFKVDIVNANDRADTINGLYQFSFEAVLHWEKTS